MIYILLLITFSLNACDTEGPSKLQEFETVIEDDKAQSSDSTEEKDEQSAA